MEGIKQMCSSLKSGSGMAQKKDEIATVNTNAITQTTTEVHRIRWTIENVSQLPLDTRIVGPDFYPTKTSLLNIAFEKSAKFLFVYLRNKSDRTIKMERSLILVDCNGTTLHHDKMGRFYTLVKNKDIDIINPVAEIKRFNALPEDILVIDCCLKMEGSIVTEISLFKSELESREHLVEDLKAMVNNPVDSDFTLQIDNDYIHSHRSLLRARSKYFRKMFDAEMEEPVGNSVAIIGDVSYPIMYQLVQFLYTGSLAETFEDNNIHEMSDLYLAANQYGVVDLKAVCADRLVSFATVYNICLILQLAHGHKDEDLKTRAMNFISLHFNELQNVDAFNAFMSNELDLASEVLDVVFKNV